MEFLKKHYEKIILSAVLLGLAVAVMLMVWQIGQEEKSLSEKREGIRATEKPYRPIDLSVLDATLARSKKPTSVALSGPHNTINPVLWQERPDGTRIKVVTGTEVGPAAAKVTSITPLRMVISMEPPKGSSYTVSVLREDQGGTKGPRPTARYVSTNSPKTDLFLLKEVKGTPEKPQLVLELTERLAPEKQEVTISVETPFTRVDAYTADLKYEVENLTFSKLRDGATVAFGGEEYSVEIQASAVILSAKSSTKRTTLKY